jgi:hypothetical protein
MSEVKRNGLATKTGAGGTIGLTLVAVIDAIVTGGIDADTRTALIGALVLAVSTMLGKYAQAVAEILSRRPR